MLSSSSREKKEGIMTEPDSYLQAEAERCSTSRVREEAKEVLMVCKWRNLPLPVSILVVMISLPLERERERELATYRYGMIDQGPDQK
mmetsp:Transcript_31056/g.62250  ORF Transcript_31056/g.62250 Transcript_31056/m.62250 type:complete len:88 (+) Transcript_31056:2368-2631(+)